MHLELMNLSLLARIRHVVSTQLPAHSVTDVDTCMTVAAHEALWCCQEALESYLFCFFLLICSCCTVGFLFLLSAAIHINADVLLDIVVIVHHVLKVEHPLVVQAVVEGALGAAQRHDVPVRKSSMSG